MLWPSSGKAFLKKARASGRNVGKVFNPVLKLVFENYPFSCLSQLRSPHFIQQEFDYRLVFTRAIKEGVACIHKNLSIQVNDISHWMKDGNSSLVHLFLYVHIVCTTYD